MWQHFHWVRLEQLERLCSEDTPTPTPSHPMITHTTDQFILDPKSKQDKVKFIEFAKTSNFLIL